MLGVTALTGREETRGAAVWHGVGHTISKNFTDWTVFSHRQEFYLPATFAVT